MKNMFSTKKNLKLLTKFYRQIYFRW